MPILSPADLAFFREHGFLVVPGVLPQQNLQAAIDVICTFLGARLDDPSSWYSRTLGVNGIVPIRHSQAFWNNRQHPRVHTVFRELLETEALWVTMDRGSFKPPVTTDRPEYHDESPIHWDRDPRVPSPYPVQGVLYLTDTTDTQVRSTREPDVSNFPLVRVGASAGSLVIWSSLLPHGTGRNWADTPRLAQYIMMYPVEDEATRRERIALWRQKRAPQVWRGWPGQLDPEPGEPAVLTALGRKLLGLDLW